MYQQTVERMRSHLDITTRCIVLSLPIQIRIKKILRPYLQTVYNRVLHSRILKLRISGFGALATYVTRIVCTVHLPHLHF